MATRSAKSASPLAFDLPLSLVDKIAAIRKGRNLKSASEVVRLALDEFDLDRCEPGHEPQRQISVRISAQQRATLHRFAKSKDSSVGELIRLALESLTVKPPRRR